MMLENMYEDIIKEIRSNILDKYTRTARERTKLFCLLAELETYVERKGVAVGRNQMIDEIVNLKR